MTRVTGIAHNRTPTPVDTPLSQVREFHETFDLPVGDEPALPNDGERDLRRELLNEEHNEYVRAELFDDLVGIADALADMVCVIYGTALSYGIDLDAVVAEVHRSNMTKERHPTQVYPSKNVVKTERYSPPDIAAVLGGDEQEPNSPREFGDT